MRIGHLVPGRGIRGSVLLRTGGARRQLVVVLEEVLQVPVVPLRRLVGPRTLEPAGDRVGALAAATAVFPAEAQRLDGRSLGFGTDAVRTDGTMAFAERVAADDERDRLLVVHRHTTEGLADVMSSPLQAHILA